MMQNTENTIYFNFSYFALKLLGKGLYSNHWTAISELVANGLDAQANCVKIYINMIDKEHSTIEIMDNGTGMSYEDLANKYVLIGKDKRTDDTVDEKLKNQFMGRKGIGKLAALYLSNKYYLLSKTKEYGEGAWCLDASNVDGSDIPHLDRCHLKSINIEAKEAWNVFETGTMIRLTNVNLTNFGVKSIEGFKARLNIYQNSVVIFDRGYYSEDMFRYCVEHQHLCLMRLKQNYNIAKKCSGDIITVLPGNEKDRTEDTKIRVIEVILNDGTKEYLATNLFDSHISQQMFRELYFYRWPVETKYKELKSRLAIEEFSGATTTSVLQEFYINVLLSNLSSLIKNQVDEEIQITAKSTNKYRYQANRAFIIGRIKTIVPKILCNLFDLSVIDRLYKESLRCRSQIMPERTFRRKKNKAIGRTHFNNKKVAF